MARFLGAVGVGLRRLRHRPGRTTLAVRGIILAILLVVALGSLGYGLATTGEEAIDWLDRELWASSGPIAFAPSAVGGVENPIEDAHQVAARMEQVEGVAQAQALAFQAVYVSPDGEKFARLCEVTLTPRGADRGTHRSDTARLIRLLSVDYSRAIRSRAPGGTAKGLSTLVPHPCL